MFGIQVWSSSFYHDFSFICSFPSSSFNGRVISSICVHHNYVTLPHTASIGPGHSNRFKGSAFYGLTFGPSSVSSIDSAAFRAQSLWDVCHSSNVSQPKWNIEKKNPETLKSNWVIMIFAINRNVCVSNDNHTVSLVWFRKEKHRRKDQARILHEHSINNVHRTQSVCFETKTFISVVNYKGT